MSAQTVLGTDLDSPEQGEDRGGRTLGDGSNIIYYLNGQAYQLSKNGYLPLPVVAITQLVQVNSHILLVSSEEKVCESIPDDMDIYAQPYDQWLYLENLIQARISREVYGMDLCEYCTSGLASVARLIFDTYRGLSLNYIQFGEKSLALKPCPLKTPS